MYNYSKWLTKDDIFQRVPGLTEKGFKEDIEKHIPRYRIGKEIRFNEKDVMDHLWFPMDDVCKHFWVSESTVKRWVKNGLDWLGDDKTPMFCDSSIDDFILENCRIQEDHKHKKAKIPSNLKLSKVKSVGAENLSTAANV